MAIDTEAKRRSALGRSVLPRPDGTISQADRQHKVWKYAGILASAAVAEVVVATRFDLLGSSDKKFALLGSDNTKFDLLGSSDKKFGLIGDPGP